MRYIHCVPAVALAFGLLLSTPLITDAAVLPGIVARKEGIDGMGFASIILAVIDYLKGSNAYDPSTPDKCKISMYTTAGGNCETYINCDQNDGWGTSLTSQWQVCYRGGNILLKPSQPTFFSSLIRRTNTFARRTSVFS